MTQTTHLTRAEERRLAEEYRRTRAPQLESRLLRSQLGLVWQLARSHHGAGVDLEDLAQEGLLGLLHAIRRFDPAVGVRLSSYAAWWIRAYQYRYLIRNYRLVRIGTTQAQRRIFFRLGALRARLLAAGIEPTVERIAQLLRVDADVVRELQPRLDARDLPLDAPAHADGGPTRIEELPAHEAAADDAAAARQLTRILRRERDDYRAGLDRRRRALFDARWLDDEAPTLKEMGARIGVSRERARQLEQRMLEELRERVEACVSA